jgi:hypothetical protein
MMQSRKTSFWKYLTYLFFGLMVLVPFVGIFGNDDYDFSEEEVKRIFSEMETIVDARYTPQVRGHIVTYLKVNREKTNDLLERAAIYFPIIEKYLHDHNLPDDLKYLAIVESALNPRARSRMGAVGLWQFMSYTGKEHGLRLYSSVDERRDPHKSTLAAMQYLTTLYDQFGDWALAMAAYNSGPGRVRSAIRRSGSNNFWELYRYLPRETRGYIPAFIAATYVFKHHREFGFVLKPASPDLLFTEHIMIYNRKITFDQISEITGLEKSIIKDLNPSYLYDYVPKSSYGYGLTLPKRFVGVVKAYLGDSGIMPTEIALDQHNSEEEFSGILQQTFTSQTIRQRMHLEELAELYKVDPYQIKYWNNLSNLWLNPGMELEMPLYLAEGEPVLEWFERIEPIEILPITPNIEPFNVEFSRPAHTLIVDSKPDVFYADKLVIRRGESILDAMRRMNNTSEMNSDLIEASEKLGEGTSNFSYGKSLR